MKGMKAVLNVEYGSIHAFYWMAYAGINSFASVFLLARGYSNTDIGIIFAVANVAAVFMQPLLADIADRSKRFSLVSVASIATVLLMLLTLGTFIIHAKSAALTVIYILMLAGHTTLQPLFNSLCFKISQCGIHVNFGLCRAFGSLAFSILTLFLGGWAEKYGTLALPFTSEVTLAMILVSLLLVTVHYRKASREKENRADAPGEEGEAVQAEPAAQNEEINLMQFVKRNKVFFVLMIGTLGLYFANGVLGTFMLQIIDPLGGTSEDMGRIFSVMAFLEIPTLVFFEQINRRFSCQFLLKVAALGYLAKTIIIWLAGSVMTVLLAHVFQLISFALFLPAIVKFIDQTMSRGEAVKGQALFTTVTTASTIACSLSGGFILDLGGASTLMLISAILTAAGALIVFLTVDRI